MNLRKLALAGAVAVLTFTIVACHDDDDAANAAAPLTLKEFAVSDINTRTSDTAEPQELNDLSLDASSEDPGQYDDLLMSS